MSDFKFLEDAIQKEMTYFGIPGCAISIIDHVYGLTKGQTSPRSDLGFKTKTTPTGNIETPVSTLEMALAAGVTFLAQGFSPQLQELTDLIVAAVKHPGFSLVNVFSPCVTFNKVNTYEWFKDKLVDVKDIAEYDNSDKGAVLNQVLEHETTTGA